MTDLSESVVCSLSGKEIPRKRSISFRLGEEEEEQFIDINILLDFVSNPPLKNIVLDWVSRDPIFNEVISLRNQLIAKEQGRLELLKQIQEEAVQAGIDLSSIPSISKTE